MAPLIEVSESVLKGLDQLSIPYELREENATSEDNSDFIYVPSISLYVAKERTHFEKNWYDAHRELQSKGNRMLTIPEFIEFLKYTRENNPEVYNDITEVRSPWRAEWIDADFKIKNKKLYINSNHVLDSNGNLIPEDSKPLSRITLMKDSRISLEDWIKKNHTKQGFPTKKTKSGDLYYWYPKDDNNSVARFYAYDVGSGFSCGRDPSGRSFSLGVRAVRKA